MNINLFPAVLIFVVGFGIGTFFNQPTTLSEKSAVSSSLKTETAKPQIAKNNASPKEQASSQERDKPKQQECDPLLAKKIEKFQRSPKHQREKKMGELLNSLYSASRDSDLEKQNEVIAELISLGPKHINTFKAKVHILQNDGDFEKAHETLLECANLHPEERYCHRRLANIRTSTHEERIKHGKKCLELDPKDGLCLYDLAMGYMMDEQYEKSIELFSKALEVKEETKQGFFKEHIYWQLGVAYEKNDQPDLAIDSFENACRHKLKYACDRLDQLNGKETARKADGSKKDS